MVESKSLVASEQRIARTAVKPVRILAQATGLAIAFSIPGIVFGGAIGAAICLSAIGVLFTCQVRLTMRQARGFVIENQCAADAMNRGDLDTAQEIWDFWSEIRTHRRIMVMSCHNLAWVWMLQGRFEEAKKLHIENNTYELRTLQRVGLAKTGAADLALVCALSGDLPLATVWLAQAESRNKAPQQPNGAPMVVLARAVIELRTGHTDEALETLDEGWALCESRLTGSTMQTLRLVRAFARLASRPAEAGVDVSDVRPRYLGEHLFLAKSWPEMAAFLAANELDR